MKKDYQSPYSKDGIYGNFAYGSPWVSRGLASAILIDQTAGFGGDKQSILTIGAGNGYELVYFLKRGYDATGIDLYVPDVKMVKEHTVVASADDMPFEDNQFDMVMCCEVFEHIPEDICMEILKECRRVAKNFYFTIATTSDEPFNTHINIHEGEWWIKEFRESGMKIVHAAINARCPTIHNRKLFLVIYASGVTIYGEC